MLHLLVFVDGPEHGLPPFAGGGLVHVRVWVLIPPPHDLEHDENGPQAEYLPFTKWRCLVYIVGGTSILLIVK